MKTVHLMGVGKCKAKPVKELQKGVRTFWNYGYSCEVYSIEPTKTGKSYKVRFKDHTIISDVRIFRADTLIAISLGGANDET